MGRSIEPIQIAEWKAMPATAKAAALADNGCLAHQGTICSAFDAIRPSWGCNFSFGSSPIPTFALSGEVECISEALLLGASPFARDLEGDGPFEYAARQLSSKFSHSRDNHRTIASLCWAAGKDALDPSSPQFLGAEESDAIRHDIAHAFYSNGAVEEARAAGIPIEASWLFGRPDPTHLLRAQMIQWGRPADLIEFLAAGFEFSSWVTLPQDSDPQASEPRSLSLWHWLDDSSPTAEEVARFLILAGCDPRAIPPNALDAWGKPLDPNTAATPMATMAQDPAQSLLHSFVLGLLLSCDERAALDNSCPEPEAPAPRKPGL